MLSRSCAGREIACGNAGPGKVRQVVSGKHRCWFAAVRRRQTDCIAGRRLLYPAPTYSTGQVRDWGHQFLYDSATVRKSLELADFKQINEYRVEDKTDPVFGEVERRTRNEGSDLWS